MNDLIKCKDEANGYGLILYKNGIMQLWRKTKFQNWHIVLETYNNYIEDYYYFKNQFIGKEIKDVKNGNK